MTDYEFTDKLAITLILWDRDRDDEVYVTIHPVFTDGQPTFFTFDTHMIYDEPGDPITELPLPPHLVNQLVACLRAPVYARRRREVEPRPRDHAERQGRQPGSCDECLGTGWVVIPTGSRRRVAGKTDTWTHGPLRWQPCPRCLEPKTTANEAA